MPPSGCERLYLRKHTPIACQLRILFLNQEERLTNLRGGFRPLLRGPF